VALQEAGYSVIVADDLRNSKVEVLERLEEITGEAIHFYKRSGYFL